MGGGIFTTENSDVWMYDSTVSGNSASGFGGGIAVHGNGTVSMYWGNTVENNHSKYGGGLFIGRQATAIVQHSTISGNVAKNAGGIGVQYGVQTSYNIRGGKLTMTYSTVSGNIASSQGGGLDIGRYTHVSLTNSTVSGNSAGDNGGGLNAYPSGTDAYGPSHITLSFCTFTGNSAADDGGGISTGEHTDLTLQDTLVSGNHASTGREVRTNTDDSDIKFGHYNIFGYSGSSGLSGQSHGSSDIIPTVPLSQILNTTLTNNGGYTYTHALVSGSPAIDHASTSDLLPLDQRSFGRPASGSTIRDIGAFEFGAIDTTAPAALSSGQAQKVGGERPKGSLRLSFGALLPHTLDLRRVTFRVLKGLAERGVELVEGVPELEWAVQEGAKADRVTLKTVGGQGKGKVELRLRGSNVLEGRVQLSEVRLRTPQFCAEEEVELASEVVIGDGLQPSIRLQLREAWACERRRNGRVKGLVVRQE